MSQFNVKAEGGFILISDGERVFKLTPAEVDRATALIGLALGMESLKALPSHITNKPFVVRFTPGDALFLERTDEGSSVNFTWSSADDLIKAIRSGLDIALDQQKLSPGARGAAAPSFNEEPFI